MTVTAHNGDGTFKGSYTLNSINVAKNATLVPMVMLYYHEESVLLLQDSVKLSKSS
jgi:hypothetical protein